MYAICLSVLSVLLHIQLLRRKKDKQTRYIYNIQNDNLLYQKLDGSERVLSHVLWFLFDQRSSSNFNWGQLKKGVVVLIIFYQLPNYICVNFFLLEE